LPIWVGGIGSLVAVYCGRKTRQLIRESGNQLNGLGRTYWCLIVGSIGLLICVPLLGGGLLSYFFRN
jgi:hypothetical protein